MKRHGNILAELCSFDNFSLAFARAAKGKRQEAFVSQYQEHLDENLHSLCKKIRNEDFEFGNYHLFRIFDPKERLICAADFEERVVHHAIVNVCGDILEKSLIDDSFACRKGKGQYAALTRARQFMNQHPWCLKLDMSKYFDSIDHGILTELLARKFKEASLLRLWRKLLASYETLPGKGLPIGNLTSQYLANLYLDSFDRFAGNDKGRSYLRYMDDILITGEYEDLRQLRHASEEFLQTKLALTIKHGGSLHRCDRGVNFLGYRLFPEKMLLNHRSKQRFLAKWKRYNQSFEEGKWTEREFQERVTALFAFVNHANSWHWRHCILEKEHGEPRPSWRELEQQCQQLNCLVPEQQRAVQQEQQQRLPFGCPPRSSRSWKTH